MLDAKPTTISKAMIYLLKWTFGVDDDPSFGFRRNALLHDQ
jgi:hypothetical protein